MKLETRVCKQSNIHVVDQITSRVFSDRHSSSDSPIPASILFAGTCTCTYILSGILLLYIGRGVRPYTLNSGVGGNCMLWGPLIQVGGCGFDY
jgi:hypothetical protein